MPRRKDGKDPADDGNGNGGDKKRNDKKLLEYSQQLPTLTTENFVDFKDAFKDLIYYAEWEADVVDLQQESADIWDGAEEADEDTKKARRLAYALLRMKLNGSLRHLVTGIRPGDAKGLWKRIFSRFCTSTSGALQELKTEAENLSMQSTNLDVERYASLLQVKYKFVLEIKKQTFDEEKNRDMTNIFINGLLRPEFNAVIVYLRMLPPADLKFETIYTTVFNFAADNKLKGLRRGTNRLQLYQANPKNNNKVNKPCSFYARGACKKGNKCNYLHDDSSTSTNEGASTTNKGGSNGKGKGRQGMKSGADKHNPNNFPRGSCWSCGETSHLKRDCPKLAEEKSSEPDSSTSKQANVFMMVSGTKPTTKKSDWKTILVTQQTKQAIIEHKNNDDRSKEERVAVDGASTSHVCPWPEVFTPGSLVPCDYSCQLGVGLAEAKFMGTVEIISPVNGGTLVTLTNVLFMPDCPFMLLSEGRFDDGGCDINKYNRKVTIRLIDAQGFLPPKIMLSGNRMTWTNLYHVSLSFKYSKPVDPFIFQISKIKEGAAETGPPSLMDHVEKQNKKVSGNGDKFDGRTQPLIELETVPKNLCPEPCTQLATVVPAKNLKNEQILLLSPSELIHVHESGGHFGFNRIRAQHGMPTLPTGQLPVCRPCIKWNSKAAPIKRKKKPDQISKNQVSRVLQVVHIDKGHMPVSTWDGEFYFQVIVDFYSRKIWQQKLQTKNQDFAAFLCWFKQVRAEKPNNRIVELIADNEYDKGCFQELAKQEGFKIQPQSAHTGKAWLAERAIGLLRRVTLPQLDVASASFKDWGYSMDHAEVILNDSWTAFLPPNVTREDVWLADNNTIEFWTDNKGSVSQQKHKYDRWGCFGALKKFTNTKAQPGTDDVMNLGFNKHVKGKHVLRILKTGRITSSINVRFNSQIMPCAEAEFREMTQFLRRKWPAESPTDMEGGAEQLEASMSSIAENANWRTPIFENSDILSIDQMRKINEDLGISTPEDPPESLEIRQGTRDRYPSTKCVENQVNAIDSGGFTLLTSTTIYPIANPTSEKEAMNSPQKDQWIAAKESEMQEVWKTGTYELVPRPKGVRVIGSRFVYKIKWRKRDPFQLRQLQVERPLTTSKEELKEYIVERYKARWIAQGYGLKDHYKNAYSFTLTNDADRVFFCCALYYLLKIFSEDFKNFFLVGPMDKTKDTYVEQAPGYEVKGKEDDVCFLKKSLYGIPPSPRIAQDYLIKVLTDEADCKRLVSEPMAFVKREGESVVLSGYYVDDSRHYTNDEELLKRLAKTLADNKLKGELKQNPEKFLGLKHIYYENTVLVHQDESVLQYINKCGLNPNSKPMFTPMDPNSDERKEKALSTEDSQPTDIKTYQSKTGSLIWLIRCRYDALFPINTRCKNMSAPNVFDDKCCKRLARFFLGEPMKGLTFHMGTPSINPLTYSYVDCSLYVQSVSGVGTFIGLPNFKTHENLNAAVIAFTKTETEAVVSTMHGEILAIGHGVLTSDHVTNLREEAGFPQQGPAIIFTDNDPAIRFLSDSGSVPSRQTRHLRRRVEFIKEAIRTRRVVLRYVPTHLNCADLLTKPLDRVLHERHSKNLMGSTDDVRFGPNYPCGCTPKNICRQCYGCFAHFCDCEKPEV